MLQRLIFSLCGLLITVIVAVVVNAIGSAPVLLPAVLYDSGGNSPSALTIADLNRDGVDDVVVAHFGSADGSPNGTLGVFIGNADATFRPVAVYSSGATGAASVAAVDINADGAPDLVVGNNGPAAGQVGSAVAVLLGNGDGTFQSPVGYSSNGAVPSIAIADLNGDAKPDVAVANRSGNLADRTVDVLLGNGNGTLRQAVPYDSGGAIATGIAVADLNGDGKPDLIVSNWVGFIDPQNGAVGVLLGNGDGTFQQPVSYGSGGYGGSSLEISDVDGDGNQDVVVANCDPGGTQTCSSVGSGAGAVGVLLGNGDGTLRDAVSYDMGGLGAGSVAIVDVDGDGTRDILVASCAGHLCPSAVAVLLGNGDGSFKAPVSYDSGGLGAGSIRAADLNGDGLPEVLTTTCASPSCNVAALAVLVNDTPRADTPPVLSVSAGVAASGVVSASGSNLISVENAKAGTVEWKLTNNGVTSRAIEGYASLTSVPRGGRIDLFVSTAAPSYTMDIFRMGYYGGLGARRMMPTITRTGRLQAACPMDSLGMIECAWSDPYSLLIPRPADATDWMSGFYLVKLTESAGGKQQYITFTVRDDARATDILIVQAVNTYQAYNVWGGKSLYGTLADRDDHANGARRVSFNRPYYGEGSYGASGVLGDEAEMSRWLEHEGYDVSYATNVDLDANASLLLNHRAYLTIGHDEYWSKAMFDNVELARDSGVSLGFFVGNTIYWQVRYEPSIVGQQPRRSMVGYKSAWKDDPMLAIDPTQVTGRWRDAPINRPEDSLQGVLFVTQSRPVMVIEDASHWAFTGTGLKNGDRLTAADGTPFLGPEIDQMGKKSPPNTRRLAHSPATVRAANFSDVTIYRAPSGATVFASGSIGWSATVPQIQQMTRNVLARLIINAFPDSPPVRPALPAPFVATEIGNTVRPGFVALAGPDSFTLNGAGSGANGTDSFYYVHQPLDGDGEMVVRLNSLQKFFGTRAGIMIRESLTPTARYVSLLARPSEIASSPEGVEFHVKDVVAANRKAIASRDQKQPNWMRLRRTGNTFESFASVDGVAWTPVGSFTLALPRSAFIGVAVYSAETGVWVSANFDKVRVIRPGTGDSVLPTVSLTAPANGSTVSGTVAVSATASDNVGVAGVQFKLDGANLGAEDTAAPYAASWNSASTTNGSHTLSAQARDAAGNRRAATVTVNVANTGTTLPSPWVVGNVGTVGTPTGASYANGVFTLDAGGQELWVGTDAFGCVYRSWTGDGDLITRVATVTLPSGATYAQGGIMFRDGLAANAMHASIVIGTDSKLKFRLRKTVGGTTLSDGPSAGTASIPRWLKLSRRGNSFSAFYSQDGASWTPIPVTGSTVALPSTVLVGVLALRNGGTASTRATFSNVSVAGVATWTDADVGTVGTAGSSTFTGGTFEVRGGGTDIWATSDAFHFVYQPWSGDGTFVARLASLTNATGATFSLGAIMFRESLAANSRHAAMMVTTDGKAKFRRRTTTGGTTLSDGSTTGTTTVPRWLKLVRSGSSFSAYISADGATWSQVTPTTTIAMPATLYVGMLALRSGGSSLATARFTNVSLTR